MMKYLFVLMLLILSACNSDFAARPTHDPNIPKVLQATDGATGVFQVSFPGTWVGIETSTASINIANSGFAMRNYEKGIENLQEDHLAGTVSAILKNALPETVNREDIADVVLYISGRISAPQSDILYTFGSVNVENAIATIDGLGGGDNIALDVRLLLVDRGEAYGIVFFAARIGQLEPHFDTLNSIAQSFSFINAQDFLATQAQQ
ncbi:MAG: hypothetical protein Q9P44_06535 [Anaerolineae bacterium]|nr:hypothetical protein [Anaerolineae bacterium]